ncbi:hypothetical protein BGLA2_1810016 [Burkholderia gladioli]|nr:hypothetical protein BGLA2_1810016 [Burkholderia gladioli]
MRSPVRWVVRVVAPGTVAHLAFQPRSPPRRRRAAYGMDAGQGGHDIFQALQSGFAQAGWLPRARRCAARE